MFACYLQNTNTTLTLHTYTTLHLPTCMRTQYQRDLDEDLVNIEMKLREEERQLDGQMPSEGMLYVHVYVCVCV